MIHFVGRGILLDIEGTTSSVRFVYDVLFPYARRELDSFLDLQWQSAAVQDACDQIAVDARWTVDSPHRSLNDTERREHIRLEVLRLMDRDAKATGLKQLQGLIWQRGFESGELQSHVYDDVPSALTRWNQLGIDVRIYSSGSVLAQRLFFRHTTAGNLSRCFREHYDTTVGHKKEATSYRTIAADYGFQAGEILFVSDIAAELDAAKAAGLQTALSIRPGNAEQPASHGHAIIHSFAEILPATGPAPVV
jgi:enolase-phosphatase E1